MAQSRIAIVFLCALACTFSAHAGPKKDVKQAFQDAKQPAWSIKGERQDLKVSVSPAGRTLSVTPYVGEALGISVDYLVNEHYREAIRQALGDYDLAGFVRSCLEKRLKAFAPQGLREVNPLVSTAGYSNERDAEKARLQGLRDSGVDLLLDLKVTYGIYGTRFAVRFDIEGKLLDLANRRRLWMDGIPGVAEPFMADIKFEHSLLKYVAYVHTPRFAANEDAMKRLTGNDAALLKADFEKAVEGGISAVLCDMGLVDEPMGEYFLGRKAFQKKRYADAQEHFVRALNLDPGLHDAASDLSVTYARFGATDEAIGMAGKILAKTPDYAPAAFNLAWWNAFDRKNAAEARRYYDKALAEGVLPSKKLERALRKLETKK
jgi:tetratricopeptide (TPR) repeat protein